MTVVVIYGFQGKYTGTPEYEYKHPELGVTHKCMLFLSQTEDSDEYGRADSECAKYGFTQVTFSRRGKIHVDALNTDLYRGFAGFYEEALSSGSALVYYPNA